MICQGVGIENIMDQWVESMTSVRWLLGFLRMCQGGGDGLRIYRELSVYGVGCIDQNFLFI